MNQTECGDSSDTQQLNNADVPEADTSGPPADITHIIVNLQSDYFFINCSKCVCKISLLTLAMLTLYMILTQTIFLVTLPTVRVTTCCLYCIQCLLALVPLTWSLCFFVPFTPPGDLASSVFWSRIREESLVFEDMLRAATDIANRLESSSQVLQASFTKQLKDIKKIHR